MRGRKSSLTIVLTPEDRAEIEHWQRATTCPAGLARRGRVLLLLEQGETLTEAARTCGMSVRHVRKWAERFRARGLAGLRDKPRPGRKPVFSPRGRAAPGQDGLRAPR
jgi:DNA-directed RNA polymerase specialized sigma24 family protein